MGVFIVRKKHYQHHRFPGTEKDPDFLPRSNNFFVWWFVFMKNYVTWWQFRLMAVALYPPGYEHILSSM
jgi:beta-carotene ketolase (CrtW type)